MSAALSSRLNGRQVLAAATVTAIVVGSVTGLQAYLARIGSAHAVPLGYAVQNRTLAALAWVLVGAGVVWAARRWPLGSPRWKRLVPVHAAGALLAGLSVNAILHTLLWLLSVHTVSGSEVPRIIARDAIDHAHLNALVYALVIAVVWRLDRARLTVPPPSAPAVAATTNGSRYAARLTARRRDTLSVVAVDDVDWIEGADDYACLHVGARRHLTDDRLRELERILDPDRFVRVHRSALVNLSRVREVQEGRWGDAVAVLRDGTRVRVSRTRREALMSALRPPDEGRVPSPLTSASSQRT